MSALKQAQKIGAVNLKQISDLSGVSKQTLINWSKNKPMLFEVVVKGAIELWKTK